jgi:hypothetical protein
VAISDSFRLLIQTAFNRTTIAFVLSKIARQRSVVLDVPTDSPLRSLVAHRNQVARQNPARSVTL